MILNVNKRNAEMSLWSLTLRYRIEFHEFPINHPGEKNKQSELLRTNQLYEIQSATSPQILQMI